MRRQSGTWHLLYKTWRLCLDSLEGMASWALSRFAELNQQSLGIALSDWVLDHDMKNDIANLKKAG